MRCTVAGPPHDARRTNVPASPASFSQLSPRTTAGRLVLAGWGFMALILANLYISSMAAILATRSQRISNVQGMDDLVDLPVGIFMDDQTSFQRFALNVRRSQRQRPPAALQALTPRAPQCHGPLAKHHVTHLVCRRTCATFPGRRRRTSRACCAC